MIKVEHTRKHKLTFLLSEGHDIFETLVAEAKLVLIKCKVKDSLLWVSNETKKIYLLSESRIEKPKGIGDFVKPILISETEKIEVGELFAHYWYDDEYSNERNQKRILISTADTHTNDVKHRKNYIGKILALPEHFSQEQLQMIVDGKLKDGDKVMVLVEAWSSKATDFSEVDRSVGFIKLNPHITIYPVEEKLVPISLVEKAFDAGKRSVEPTIRFEKYGDMEAYPSFDLRYTYKEWFEQNVK